MKAPKVALFYDWLNQWGGAEKVLLDLINIFPDAPVFTLIYNHEKTKWLPVNTKVIPSFINRLPFSKNANLFYTPLFSLAQENFDFSQYDIVISTTSVLGYDLITSPNTLFICFLHNVNRYVYQTPKLYSFLKPLLKFYKKNDSVYCQRPDYLFCNSQTVQQRIDHNLHRQANIIYPGIDTDFFKPAKSSLSNNEKYFLVVSRLVAHKKIDLVINACHQLNLPLKIVGNGRLMKRLNKYINNLNDPNIKLLGSVDNQQLLKLYQNCTALICPQEEDFGLTPIEAQACGKPIIAYKKGGILETVKPKITGIFFEKQTVDSLKETIQVFLKTSFSPTECRKNSLKFSNQFFMLNFKQAVSNLWKNQN